MTLQTLYAARSKPVQGLNTAMDPMALPDGFVPELTNYRVSGGLLECRGGMTASLGTIIASGAYRGHWWGYLWGGYKVVVAVYVSSKTRLYYSTDYATWTEMTESSGAFGDTRMTGNGPVSFAVVPDPFNLPTVVNTERLLAADGTGAVRGVANSYLQGGLSGSGLKAHTLNAITPPNIDDHPVRVLTMESTLLNLQGTPTFTVPSAGEFNFASSGSAPNKVARLTIDPTVDNGDNVSVSVSTSTLAVTDADRHVLIGAETTYTMLWDKLKVELGSEVLWDPTAPGTYARPIPVAVDNSNRTVWIFQLAALTASGAKSGELKFTWAAATNEAPTAAVTADLFLLAVTYGSPGYADWSIAVTNGSSSSLCESPGVIYSQYVTDRISDFGGPILNGLRLPRSPLLKATFNAKTKNVSAADLAAGVDVVRWYYKRPGDGRYRYMGYDALASVSGSTWSRSSGTEFSLLEKGAGPDSYLNEYPEVYLPDAYHIPPPPSKCLAFANDRLFCGGSAGSTKNFYVSANRNAFRMRAFTGRVNGVVDPDDPVTRTVGSGVFQTIVPMSSSLLGADTIFIFTSEGVFVTGGNTSGQLEQVARVSKFGTVSPFSIAELNGTIFYLDTERQVRKFKGGQPVPISKNWVDDNLAGIPASYVGYVTAAVFNDLYYLAYTPTGATTNTKILVWEDDPGRWFMDTPPKACQGMMSVFDGTNNKKRLIVAGLDGSDLKAYEYDLLTQTQDLGTTNITCAVTFPELHAEDGKAIFINRVGVTCDDITGSTGSVVRTYKPDGSTGTGSINLNGNVQQVVRYDGNQTIAGGAGNGVSAKVRVSLPLTAGAKVYKIVAEIEPRGHAYDRST